MSVVDLNTNEWNNADTLLVRFGTDRAKPKLGGEYATLNNGTHVNEYHIDLVALSALSTFGSDIDVIIDDDATIPTGALIEKVELIVTEVTAGSSATLDVGFYNLNRSTVYDQDALIVGGTTTWHTGAIGTTVTYTQGSTEHGSSVGEVLTAPVLVSAQVDGAAYTEGAVKIRVYWSVPLAAEL